MCPMCDAVCCCLRLPFFSFIILKSCNSNEANRHEKDKSIENWAKLLQAFSFLLFFFCDIHSNYCDVRAIECHGKRFRFWSNEHRLHDSLGEVKIQRRAANKTTAKNDRIESNGKLHLTNKMFASNWMFRFVSKVQKCLFEIDINAIVISPSHFLVLAYKFIKSSVIDCSLDLRVSNASLTSFEICFPWAKWFLTFWNEHLVTATHSNRIQMIKKKRTDSN